MVKVIIKEIIIKSMYFYWKMGWKIIRLNLFLVQVVFCMRLDEVNRKGKIKIQSIVLGNEG